MKVFLPLVGVYALLSVTSALRPEPLPMELRDSLQKLRNLRDRVASGFQSRHMAEPAITMSVPPPAVVTTTPVAQELEKRSGLAAQARQFGSVNFPSMETSMTALAFLSFGAFLLSMLLRAMNVTGTRKKRAAGEELEDMAQVALDALSTYLFDKNMDPCDALQLCKANQEAMKENGLKRWIAPITSVGIKWIMEDRSLKYVPPQWETFRNILEATDCEKKFICSSQIENNMADEDMMQKKKKKIKGKKEKHL